MDGFPFALEKESSILNMAKKSLHGLAPHYWPLQYCSDMPGTLSWETQFEFFPLPGCAFLGISA